MTLNERCLLNIGNYLQLIDAKNTTNVYGVCL